MLLPQIRFESRSRLYFDQWHYVIQIRVPEVWLLRTLDPVHIHQRIRRREEYTRIHSPDSIWAVGTLDRVFQTAAELTALKDNFSHRIIYTGACHVYTNSVENMLTLFKLHPDAEIRQANVSVPADVVMLKSDPKYPYRTYFRERDLTNNQKQSLWNWVQAQDEELTASPATKKWLNGTAKWRWSHQFCRNYYYVEHTDMSHVLMLNLVCTGLVRKTMRVLKQP